MKLRQRSWDWDRLLTDTDYGPATWTTATGTMTWTWAARVPSTGQAGLQARDRWHGAWELLGARHTGLRKCRCGERPALAADTAVQRNAAPSSAGTRLAGRLGRGTVQALALLALGKEPDEKVSREMTDWFLKSPSLHLKLPRTQDLLAGCCDWEGACARPRAILREPRCVDRLCPLSSDFFCKEPGFPGTWRFLDHAVCTLLRVLTHFLLNSCPML